MLLAQWMMTRMGMMGKTGEREKQFQRGGVNRDEEAFKLIDKCHANVVRRM